MGNDKTTTECKMMLDAMLEPDFNYRPKAGELLKTAWMTSDPDVLRYVPETRENVK